MTTNISISKKRWPKIYEFLEAQPGIYTGNEAASKRFIEGCLWITRSGAPWRFLPEQYGKWNSVYKRFSAWCDQGIWQAMLEHFAQDADITHLLLDGTVIRAHPCAAGAPQAQGGQAAQALGYSQGGFSTKVHVAVNGNGKPMRFRLTPGQRHESTQAEPLLADFDYSYALADKAYDTDAIRATIDEQGAIAVIPPKANRTDSLPFDETLYKARNLVERFINKFKHFRHLFSRFDKLDSRFLGFLHFASVLIWLR